MKQGNHYQNRRDFLRTMAILAAGATVAPVLKVVPAFAASSLQRVSEQRMMMGTFVSLTVLTPSRVQGEDALGKAFDEIAQQICIFNRFDANTPLSVLNSEGRLSGAPLELLDVVSHGRDLSMRTSGLFDVTIAPVLNLLASTMGQPDKYEMRHALSLVDAAELHQTGTSLRFGAGGMAATLDGIAKGFIADRAATSLMNCGVESFLIDAGGDIRAQGSSDGLHRPWRIAIEDPNKEGRYPSVIELRSGAVATSGGYEVFFNASRKSHHLIDPKTGTSPQYITSVSVKAPSVMQADGVATALSLMTPKSALQLIASLPECECLLLTSTGARLSSPNWG